MTELFELAALRTPHAHWSTAGSASTCLPPNGSRLYDVDAQTWDQLDELERAGDEGALADLLSRLGVDAPAYVDDTPLAEPPVRALSLAVAQKCNLGCTYCYADGGSFGSPAANMPEETALAQSTCCSPR